MKYNFSEKHNNIIGIDLFAGAGGLSLGANMAGIQVVFAIDKNSYAVSTYTLNHPQTNIITSDIYKIKKINVCKKNKISVLFGGPPCQGFSTSNQRTRNENNKNNWLFEEFFRIAMLWEPDWIVFENVRGITETARGMFRDKIISLFKSINYTCSFGVLCAADFGVPQKRSRFFIVASRHGIEIELPKPTVQDFITVKQALEDLPSLPNGANESYLPYSITASSDYAKQMRGERSGCTNHVVTKNAPHIVERYKYIPQGGNWKDIPEHLMLNYKDRSRCHTGIYHRLREDEPSIVIGNFRKNMLLHPWEDRGLSVREAARLQSFPDWYVFEGSIGFQQQQVGDAVPPLLAKAIFMKIVEQEGINLDCSANKIRIF